jgi:fumarate hydratase class II
LLAEAIAGGIIVAHSRLDAEVALLSCLEAASDPIRDRFREACGQRLKTRWPELAVALLQRLPVIGFYVKELSELTGLELKESDDLFESMQSLADAVDFSASMRTLAVTLDRIANDLRLLASGPATGLDEILLPAVQPGSSIMPGKVNPVMAEMLNMASFHVMGNDLTVMLAGQAGQLELNVMMPIVAHNLFEMMHVLIGAIRAFTDKCVLGIQANREKAEGWLARNAILVTALNPVIGYMKGAEVAKEAMATNRTIKEVVVEKGYLTAEDADRILDARSMTEGGIQK